MKTPQEFNQDIGYAVVCFPK